MVTATGEFIAIFDADFLPSSDFLERTIPFFQDPSGTTNNSDNKYSLKQIPKMSLIEIVLSIIFGASAVWGFTHQVVQFQAFHALLSMGYLSVAGYSILPVLNNVFKQYIKKLFLINIFVDERKEVVSTPQ